MSILTGFLNKLELWNDLVFAWLAAGAQQVAPERIYMIAGFLAVAGVMIGRLSAQEYRAGPVSAIALGPAALGAMLGGSLALIYTALLT